MTDRRTFLSGMGAAAVGGLGASTAFAAARKAPAPDCKSADTGPTADRFPNVLVYSQEGLKYRFYDDLLKGKICMLQFMSVDSQAEFKTMKNLQALQGYLGKRLGEDFFLYSITVEPKKDTIARLAQFAERLEAGPGWKFLTGKAENMQKIKDALFYSADHSHHGKDGQDCSMGLLRYGNEKVGLWGSVPTGAPPNWLAQRLFWVQSRPPLVSGVLRRRGPPARSV